MAIGRDLFLEESKVKAEWQALFKTFRSRQQVHEEQIEFSRVTYWADAEKMRKILGFADRLSHALCFDVAIQNGPKLEIAEKVKAAFGKNLSESEKRELFAEAIVKNSAPRFQDDVLSRKVGTLVDGTGRVHKAGYALTNWGFATPEEGDEPEDIGPPATLTANGSDFEQFFRERLPSVYRSPEYNKTLPGAAKNSQHMQFKAADVVVHGPGAEGPEDWARVLKNMRVQGEFKGGIGIYPTFVHVDTRGFNANWRRG